MAASLVSRGAWPGVPRRLGMCLPHEQAVSCATPGNPSEVGISSAPARGAYASREARFRLPAQQLSGIRYVLAPGLVSRPPNRGGGRGQDVHQAMSWRQRAGQPFGPPCPRARASQTAARLTRFCTIPCLPFTPKPTLPPPSAPVAPSGACRDCSPPRASDRHLGRWPPHAECGPGSRLPCASCRPLEPQSDL